MAHALPKLAGTKLAAAGGGTFHDVGEADSIALDEHGDGAQVNLRQATL